MRNEGPGIDLNTDFKRVYISVTETKDKTRLLTKKNDAKEYNLNKSALIYSKEPKNKSGYINLHMHLYLPNGNKSPNIKDKWVLEDTRKVKWINNYGGTERTGHYKPVRYNPDTMSGEKHNVRKFFATTDSECLKVEDFMFSGDKKALMMSHIRYEIPREFLKVYAKSKGEIDMAMVQPFYSIQKHPILPGGKRLITMRYKKDIDGYLAMFSAEPYNTAILESQLY